MHLKDKMQKNGFIFCNPKDNLENLVAQNTKNFGCDSALICSNSKTLSQS